MPLHPGQIVFRGKYIRCPDNYSIKRKYTHFANLLWFLCLQGHYNFNLKHHTHTQIINSTKCFFIHLFSCLSAHRCCWKVCRSVMVSSVAHSSLTWNIREAEFISELDIHSEAFQRCCHNDHKLELHLLFTLLFSPRKINIIHIELSHHPFEETRFQECKTVNKESKIFLLLY